MNHVFSSCENNLDRVLNIYPNILPKYQHEFPEQDKKCKWHRQFIIFYIRAQKVWRKQYIRMHSNRTWNVTYDI